VRDDNNPNFEAPAPGNRNRDNGEMFRDGETNGSTERSFKPVTEKIAIPGGDLGPSDTVIQSKKPAPGPSIDDDKKDQTLRLDTRVTSRAVAPRERRSSVAGVATAKIKTTRTLQVDAQPSIIDVVRY
jgi:hypothetical protein